LIYTVFSKQKRLNVFNALAYLIAKTMSALKGKKKIWQESTKDNSLFLSTAVQLNSESKRCRLIYTVFSKQKRLNVFNALAYLIAKRVVNNS
jgi:hypothetical protein